MTEIQTPEDMEVGIYEYILTFLVAWGTGEFTIICSEATNKSMDSMIVTVVTSSLEDIKRDTSVLMGTATGEKGLSAKLDKLDTIGTQVGAILNSVIGLSKSTAEGKIDADLVKEIDTNIRGVAQRLREIAGTQGFNFDSLVDKLVSTVSGASASQEEEIKKIVNEVGRLQQLQRISNQILQRTEQKFLIDVSYEWGSIRIKILVVNRSDEAQQIEVKSYLPQEVRPEHIIEKNDFNTGYDAEKELYFVILPTPPTLQARELLEYAVTVKDVWVIQQSNIDEKRSEALKLFKLLKEGTEQQTRGKLLCDRIENQLSLIETLQGQKNRIPAAEYISNYRDNKERMKLVDAYLDGLKRLVFPELAEGETALGIPGEMLSLIKGKGALAPGGETDKTLGITRQYSWRLILIIVGFLGLMSLIFFIIWQAHLKKARVSPEFDISPESIQMPDVGRSETP
jgi:hypothetical protein